MKTLVIVNPTSAGGRVKKKWPKIEKKLQKLGVEFDVAFTESPGHAIDIARDASLSNYDLIVCAGGDGTSNEIINGIMFGNPQKTLFGALPL
ncbi:MAG: acylglycerol kinase family protein, partial [Promethearchaeota archaeon]